jgi:hypothetical protein
MCTGTRSISYGEPLFLCGVSIEKFAYIVLRVTFSRTLQVHRVASVVMFAATKLRLQHGTQQVSKHMDP